MAGLQKVLSRTTTPVLSCPPALVSTPAPASVWLFSPICNWALATHARPQPHFIAVGLRRAPEIYLGVRASEELAVERAQWMKYFARCMLAWIGI